MGACNPGKHLTQEQGEKQSGALGELSSRAGTRCHENGLSDPTTNNSNVNFVATTQAVNQRSGIGMRSLHSL